MITRERLEKISSWREKCGDDHNVMLTAAEAEEMARRLLAIEVQEPVARDDMGEIRVGRLATMNQDEYPSLGDWWVQLRIGKDYNDVLARVYGATPQEAHNRAEALARRSAPQPVAVPEVLLSAMEEVLLISDRNHEAWQRARDGIASCRASHVNPEFTTHLVGEVVAWHHPNHERNVDFRWLDFNVEPGTKLYAIKQEHG